MKSLSKIDMILVPGFAFDYENNRMSRGKGFYTRFLDKLKNVTRVGVAFDYQVVPELPVDKEDIPVDIVISDL